MNRSTDLYVDGKRHILVADDEIVNREMLENILCDEYDVLLAEDGERAYDLIRQNRNTLSLILLDLMMPKLNGLDLLSRLKEDSDFKGIPDSDMDALFLDVNHFHIVNERFGMAKGDEILRRIAGCLMTVFSGSDCVICRKNADTCLALLFA